jgi:signal transduction histidine kinase
MSTPFRRILLWPPTIRLFVVLWVGSALLAWAILATGWFAAKNRLTQIGGQVIDDMKALDATHRLETAILAYRHEDLLWHATGQDYYLQHANTYLEAAEQITQDFAPYVNTAKERGLWLAVQDRLKAFREQSNSPAGMSPQIEMRETDNLLAVVSDFQTENAGQMQGSIEAANHVQAMITYWTLGLATGTALLLSAGAWSLMRRIIRPTFGLTCAAEAFGQGDFSAKAPILHNDELGALARTFNNMAGDIADREKNRLQFVAMVVHDLKNPVLAIEMAARLLHRPDATEEERRGYLDGIREEAAHLRGIIRDLTDDIQVANGRFSIHKAEVDLGALVQQFAQVQCRAFTAHEIVVKTDEGCIIEGDARRIERVVMNLLSNAVKYSPDNTRVTLRVEKEDSQAVLTVSDQGPGIAKDDLGVLFQPFGRGRSADALAEGTGMGLYVVKQIVEAHDGRIDVQSEFGHGATFRVRLPLAVR